MNWLYLILTILGGIFLLRLVFATRPGVSVATGRTEIAADRAVLIDVREPSEHAQGVAEHSVLLPLSVLRRDAYASPALTKLKGKKLLLYCQAGTRAGLAARQLRKAGFDAVNAGGLARWQKSGWPITAPKQGTASSIYD